MALLKFWYLEVMKDRTSGLRPGYSAAVVFFTFLVLTLGCAQHEKNHEFNSGQFVVSTTVQGTGVTVYDSLYVDRYTNDSIYIFDLELFGILEDGQVRMPKQRKMVPYSSDYQCSGVIRVFSTDSLYGHVELLSDDKRDTLILQFKRLSNRGSGQNFIEEEGKTKKVLSYRHVGDSQEAIISIHEALLVLEGTKLSGYVGVHSQGSAEYYLQGTKVKDYFVGEFITLNRKNPNKRDSTVGEFKLKIKEDYMELTGDFPFIFEKRIQRTDDLVGFNYSASALLAAPNLKSSALLSSSELVDACRKGCVVINIGPKINGGNGYGLWYKVLVGNQIGWVFNGLQFHDDSTQQ